jgi:Holliday junction resolvase
VVNAKAKGTGAERHLIHQFWERNWAAIRVAGSGAIKYPVPDILAGNGIRRIAIEVKATSGNAQYITKEQVGGLNEFCKRYGAEAWIGVRFDNKGWYFVSTEELRETSSSFVLDLKKASAIGMTFDEMLGVLNDH